MNIYVCVKQVPDTEAVISVKDGNTINEATIKWIENPYDEYAIEEALKLKEKTPGSTVTAISLGSERVQGALRKALAMGVEHAIHIETAATLDHSTVARALAAAIQKDPDFGIIFMGKQAIDDDAYLTHIMLAEYLNVGVATNVIAFASQNDSVTVEREIDEGCREKIAMQAPCVIAATKGLNTPRYASMMGIMKAKKMEIKKYNLTDLAIDAANPPQTTLLRYTVPPEKPQGRLINGEGEAAVKELVRVLRDEAKVIA